MNKNDKATELLPKTWNDIGGYFDFQSIYDHAVEQCKSDAIFVEVGCFLGRSAAYLGSAIRDSKKTARVYAVDNGTGMLKNKMLRHMKAAAVTTTAGMLAENLLACGLQDVVTQIVASSRLASRLFCDATVDFCYIDADHTYAAVLDDLNAWWPKIRVGGVIAGHDYFHRKWPGVRQAVTEFFKKEDCGCPLAHGSWRVIKRQSFCDKSQ